MNDTDNPLAAAPENTSGQELPVNQEKPSASVPKVAAHNPKTIRIALIAGGICIGSIGILFFIFRSRPEPQKPVILNPPIVQPTSVIRKQNAIASASAFSAFSGAVASLSAGL